MDLPEKSLGSSDGRLVERGSNKPDNPLVNASVPCCGFYLRYEKV